MNEEKNITGYPHIDKPWEKYYNEEQKKLIIPDGNIVDYIKDKNKNNKNGIAEIYYGREYSYDELFDNISLAAKALSQIRIKKGDIIASLISNIPEAGQIWLGATEIGAICDFIDPRPDGMNVEANSKKLLEILKFENVKHIVALDICYLLMIKPIELQLKDMGIENVVIVDTDASMSIDAKIDYLNDVVQYNKLANSRMKKKDRIEDYKALLIKIKLQMEMYNTLNNSIKDSVLKIHRYKDLINECQRAKYESIHDGNTINYIGHTSGTSGSRPKPISLSNRNGIALAEQCEKAHFSPEFNETTFHLLPFFAPAGAYSNYLVNLSTGAKSIDISEFYIGDYGYLIDKYKPNYILATPAWLSLLPNYEPLKNTNLSFLHKIIYVGDTMSLEDNKKITKWLEEHNSNAKLETAHGMSELGGCGSYRTGEYNKIGSVGIPLPNTIYSIVDPDNDDELKPIKFKKNQERISGELIISCPNLTNGKLNEKTIVPHYELDGNSYIRTRDLVEMDRDGIFYHTARKDRSFVRIDGYKIKPFEIESIIETNRFVKYAKIVCYFDDRKNGFMPLCHIVLNEEYLDSNYLDIVNDIVYNTIIENPNMSSRQIPSKFKFRNSLPLTKNNKIDFIRLANEELDGNEINVDVEETNLNVGKIEIYEDNQKVLKLK